MAATSQLARNLRTVLAQMADLDRAKRIKGLREGTIDRKKPWPSPREVKQQRMIDDIEKMAGLDHFVTLRGLQDWEATGRIKYENCALIARYFGIDTDWLVYGPNRQVETPDLAAVLNNSSDSQLDRIEAKLDLLLGATQPQGEPPADGSDVDAGQQLDPDSQQEPPSEDEPETREEGR